MTAGAAGGWGAAGGSCGYCWVRPGLEGASLLILPAEWQHQRRMHRRPLLRSRAIENQCFVAACNRMGTTEDVCFFGTPAVIDPRGETLVEGGEPEALLTARIDFDTVEATQAKISIFF